MWFQIVMIFPLSYRRFVVLNGDHAQILEQYEEAFILQSSNNIPRSIILVCHSMGGFVARAAIVNSYMKREMVETIVILSSPHRSPPFVLQPSMGRYYEYVNEEWRKGYTLDSTQKALTHIVVVFISAGILDIQIRSRHESLDEIVSPSHGLVIGSPGMRNVWLSMEHDTFLSCKQLIVQVSHTLFALIDPRSGQPFSGTRERLTIFSQMLKSDLTSSLAWRKQGQIIGFSMAVMLFGLMRQAY